jgi:hypothetical protein
VDSRRVPAALGYSLRLAIVEEVVIPTLLMLDQSLLVKPLPTGFAQVERQVVSQGLDSEVILGRNPL